MILNIGYWLVAKYAIVKPHKKVSKIAKKIEGLIEKPIFGDYFKDNTLTLEEKYQTLFNFFNHCFFEPHKNYETSQSDGKLFVDEFNLDRQKFKTWNDLNVPLWKLFNELVNLKNTTKEPVDKNLNDFVSFFKEIDELTSHQNLSKDAVDKKWNEVKMQFHLSFDLNQQEELIAGLNEKENKHKKEFSKNKEVGTKTQKQTTNLTAEKVNSKGELVIVKNILVKPKSKIKDSEMER